MKSLNHLMNTCMLIAAPLIISEKKTFIPTDLVVSLLGNSLTKIIERMKKKKIFYTKTLILALSIIMKHWKEFREPWEEDGRRFLLRASNCWDTSSLTVLW